MEFELGNTDAASNNVVLLYYGVVHSRFTKGWSEEERFDGRRGGERRTVCFSIFVPMTVPSTFGTSKSVFCNFKVLRSRSRLRKIDAVLEIL